MNLRFPRFWSRVFCLVFSVFLFFSGLVIDPEAAVASRKNRLAQSHLACYSGGAEMFDGTVIGEPGADEYFFAREFTVMEGPHDFVRMSFSGGICEHRRGEVPEPDDTTITNHLVCFSGIKLIGEYAIVGRETSDEYRGGRRFTAKEGDRYVDYTIYGDGGYCQGTEEKVDM